MSLLDLLLRKQQKSQPYTIELPVYPRYVPPPPTRLPEKAIHWSNPVRGLFRIFDVRVLQIPMAAYLPQAASYSEIVTEEMMAAPGELGFVYPQIEITLASVNELEVDTSAMTAWILTTRAAEPWILDQKNAHWDVEEDRVIIKPLNWKMLRSIGDITLASQLTCSLRLFLHGSAVQGSDFPVRLCHLDYEALTEFALTDREIADNNRAFVDAEDKKKRGKK